MWDHLRTFETVARLGSMTTAAIALGVSQSTVSRHLAALEADAASPLFVRSPRLRLTERGESLLAAMVPMVDAALAARTALAEAPALTGEVVLSTTAEVVRWALVEHLPAFCARYPQLRLRILARNDVVSLAADEADLSLRLFRPTRGELVVRRVQTLAWRLYASPALPLDATTPWLGLTGSLGHIPEQRHAAAAFSDRAPRILVEEVEALAMLVAAGLGVAWLPTGLDERLDGLVEIAPDAVGARIDGMPDERALWLVVHETKRDLPRIRAVFDWLTDTVFP